LEQVDQLCDRFEDAWKAGQGPRIEDYLDDVPEPERSKLFEELLQLELAYRGRNQETFTAEEYRQRFPGQAEVIKAVFAATAHRSAKEGAAVPGASCRASAAETGIHTQPTDPGQHQHGSKDGSTRASNAADLPSLPGYEILGELGRGGMGVVYKARQVGLQRPVALKMILAGAHAGPQELARFRREAEAVAQLQHPHIVQIYEVGEQEGRPYFSLEFVNGGSLAQKLAGKPRPARQAAQLVRTLARAVHAAHQRGIIHRDLKPANVLLTADGTPKVTDFGLAKRLDAGPGLTESGAIMGTPSYMAPEQAEAKKKAIGPATDVYALGAILYEMLTGRPPFKAETPLDTILQVISKEPVPPSRLQAKVPHDLETICLKCLRKEPSKRYGSAIELAGELRRYLQDQPIQARRTGVVERSWRWCRRNRAVAGLLSAVLITLFLGTVVASFFAVRATANAQKSQENEQRALALKRDADAARVQAIEDRERVERLVYCGQIALAQREWQDNEVAHARDLLNACRPDLRGWEYAYLHRLFDGTQQTLIGHTGPVSSVAFSPDGKRIVSASWADETLKVWDAQTGRQTLSLRGWYTRGITSLGFSPDGKRIVSGSEDKTLKVWDAQTGQWTLTLKEHAGPVSSVVFSPDGKHIVSGSKDKTLKVWDAHTGRETLTLKGHTGTVRSVAFSPNGRRIVSGSDDRTLKLWDAQTGQDTLTLQGHTAYVWSVGFSPDGNRIVSGSADKTLKVWDAETGRESLTLKGHTAYVWSVGFSPDGNRIVSASQDRTLKLWDAQTGQETLTLKGHTDHVRSVAFSPDGKRIVSGSWDRTLKVWDAQIGQETLTIEGGFSPVAFSPDGKRIVSGSGFPDNILKIWDAQTGQETLTLKGHTSWVECVAFSPDGKRIVSGSEDKPLKVWDAETGRESLTLKGHTDHVRSVAFSPDGKQIVSASQDRTLKLWDAQTGQETLTLKGHTGAVFSVAFSPDGKRIVSGSEDKTLKVWDAETGQETLTLKGHTSWVKCVAFSPDGQRIVSGSNDKTLKVWDAQTHQETLTGKRMLSGS
jgi:WD40 repeat protein